MHPSIPGLFSHGQLLAEEDLVDNSLELEEPHSRAVAGGSQAGDHHICEGEVSGCEVFFNCRKAVDEMVQSVRTPL